MNDNPGGTGRELVSNPQKAELTDIINKMKQGNPPATEGEIAKVIKQYNAKEPEVTEPVEGDPEKEETADTYGKKYELPPVLTDRGVVNVAPSTGLLPWRYFDADGKSVKVNPYSGLDEAEQKQLDKYTSGEWGREKEREIKALEQEEFDKLSPEDQLAKRAEEKVEREKKQQQKRTDRETLHQEALLHGGGNFGNEKYYDSPEEDTWVEKIPGIGKNHFTNMVGDWGRAWQGGVTQSESLEPSLTYWSQGKDMSDDDFLQLAEKGRAMEKSGQTDEMLAFNEEYAVIMEGAEVEKARLIEEGVDEWIAGGTTKMMGFLQGWWNSPTVMTQYTAQSLANMAHSAKDNPVKAITGGVVAAGIAVNIPDPTDLVSGPTAFLAGAMGTISGTMETGFTTAELVQELAIEDGLDWANMSNRERADWYKEIANNEELFGDLTDRALKRGLTIGAIDFITGLAIPAVAKGVRAPMAVSRASKLTGPAVVVASAATETTLGMASEYLGQKAAGQETDWLEIYIEGFADKTFTGVQTAKSLVTKSPKYTLNGEKLNGYEFDRALKLMDDATYMTADIEIENSPSVENLVNNRKINIAVDQQIDSKVSDAKDRAKLIKLEKQRLKLKKSKNETRSGQKKLKEVEEKIDEITSKYEGAKADVTVEDRKKAVALAIENKIEKQYNKNLKFAKEGASKIGKTTRVIKDTILGENENSSVEIEKLVNEHNKANPDNKITLKDALESDGFFIGDELVINENVAKSTGQINVGAHELLHGIIKKQVAALMKSKNMPRFIRGFRRSLTKEQDAAILKEINRRISAGENLDVDTTEEWLNIFSDKLTKKELTFNEGAFKKLMNWLHELFSDNSTYNFNKKFGSGREAYNFMKEYQGNIEEGKLSDRIIKFAGDDVKDVKGETKAATKPRATTYESTVEEVDLDSLEFTELDEEGNIEDLKQQDVEDYTKRFKAGEKPGPILVGKGKNGKLYVIDGHRRVLAAKKAGITSLKAIVRNKVTPDVLYILPEEIALLEKASDTKFSKSLKDSTRKIVAKNEEIYQRIVDIAKAKGRKVSKDLVTQEMKDELVENNLARASALSNKAARVARNLTLDEGLKIDDASDWFQEYSLKLAELANTWDPSKNDSFGAYMNQLLPKKYSGILEGLKSDLETSSMDTNEGTRARAEAIAVEEDTAPKSDTRRKKTNVLKIGNVEGKADAIRDVVEVNPGDTFKEVSDNSTGKVAEIIFDVPADKITDPKKNLTYAKRIVDGIPEPSEAGNIQSFYIAPQTVEKLLKILPEESVSSDTADINEIGENIDVDREVLGRGLGLSNRVLNSFYEKTNKRSKGKKSQPFIWKLKPEFKNPTAETIAKVQEDLGITPRGKLNNYNRDIGQLLKGVAKFQAQQTALSTAQRILTEQKATKKQIASVTAAQSKVAFSNSMKEVDLLPANPEFDMDGVTHIDKLLADLGLEGIFRHRTKAEIDKWFEVFERDVIGNLPENVLPKSRLNTILRPSKRIFPGKKFGLQGKGVDMIDVYGEQMSIDAYYDIKRKELLKKDLKYGKPFEGEGAKYVYGRTYGDIFGKTEAQIKKSFDDGTVDRQNKINLSMHRQLWERINKSIEDTEGRSARAWGSWLSLVGQDTEHPHRMGAELLGYSLNPVGTKNKKGKVKLYEWEHAMPATKAYLYLLKSATSEEFGFKSSYDLVMDNFKLIALDGAQDLKLKNSGRTTSMGAEWSILTDSWLDRYFHEDVVAVRGGIDPNSIIGFDGKTFGEIFNINAQGIDPAFEFAQDIDAKSKDSKVMDEAFKASRSGTKKLIDGLAENDIIDAVSGVNPDGYSDIRFSKSHRAEYEKRLLKKNADIGTAKEAAAHIDALFNWVDSAEVPAKKKSKFEKLALHYMANNKLRMPEDGYKVIEAERLAEAKKIDPFSFKNPNEIIEKYSGDVAKKMVNPDEVAAFSNKRELKNGITIYDVDNSSAPTTAPGRFYNVFPGQQAVRDIVNAHFGKKSNPWCIVQAVDGKLTDTASEYWDQYGTKQILFKDGKLLAMRTESIEGALTDAGDVEFWSRENVRFNEIPGNDYVDEQGREVRSSFDEKTGKDSGIVYGATKGSIESGKIEIYDTWIEGAEARWKARFKETVIKPQLYLDQVERYNKKGQLHGTQEQHVSPAELETGGYASSITLTKEYKNGEFIGSRTDYGDGQGLGSFEEKLRTFTDMEGDPVHVMFSKSSKGITVLDFDDTLATTKSGVKARIPNPDGTPKPGRKVIFMAGGAGSGKGNVISKLGLKEAGYKIVNSDISLEWLKKNHGLPENQTDYTAEQRSQLSKLSAEARVIAKRKQGKYAGNGDGVVVDGTGGSVKAMGKLVQEFKDKGYDVSMVFVETSLEVAQDRNKKRKSRSLREGILNKNHEQVQGNKDAFKDMFKGNFNEVSTDNIGINDDLPMAFKNGVDKFTSSYENRRLDAEEFARDGAEIKEMGGEFDFSEFDKVVDGKTAPLFEKAMKLSGKFGTANMFILTARSPNSATAIKEFLDAQGLKIPLKNITGLGQSEASAKANWIAEKVGEGYNDFYFADDAMPNVKAVKDMLDQFDVKGKVQQAKVKFSKSGPKTMSEILDSDFNTILEETKGIGKSKSFSAAKARQRGKHKGKFKFFVPPSADDFAGLMYSFMGKGKQGDKHHAWFKEHLFDPFSKGIRHLNIVKQTAASDMKALRKAMPEVKKKLNKKVPGTEYTYEDAIRIYNWDKAGFDIDGLSNTDRSSLIKAVESDTQLQAFAQAINSISEAPGGMVEPGKHWLGGNLALDLKEALDQARSTHLQQWKDNADTIFNEANLNKIEAVFGSNFREALEDSLWRMENGGNRSRGGGRLLNNFTNWIHGSIGTTMFLNARSAMLQMISNVNFVNWSDNNMIKAAAAFGNQPQYWKDVAMIFNSPFLKQRRAGIQTDVNAAELLAQIKDSKNQVKAATAYLLQLGFTPTQIADSFAIATGGATFYRNRMKTYLKEGMTQAEAETKAFEDMMEIAEETQQSTREDKISQQQASPLGKFILAFQNTPMQYNRLIKKAAQDLVNGRGDPKANISRIVYYGGIQNLIFYGLQSALFAALFSDDEEDQITDKKKERVVNGMLDTLLRGSGIGGAVVATVKNVILKFMKESEKMDDDLYYTDPDWGNVVIEALNISPPIGIKARKIHSGLKTWEYNKDVIDHMEKTDIDNPVYDATFSVTEAVTNLPLSRLYNKVQNISEALNSDHATWKRVAMLLGWSRWSFGIKNQDVVTAKGEAKIIKAEDKKNEASKAFVEDQEEERDKGKKDIKCAAATRSGNRCGKKVLSGGNYCTIHVSVPTRSDGKKTQCSHVKSGGKRCKMQTTNQSGKCYYHD